MMSKRNLAVSGVDTVEEATKLLAQNGIKAEFKLQPSPFPGSDSEPVPAEFLFTTDFDGVLPEELKHTVRDLGPPEAVNEDVARALNKLA